MKILLLTASVALSLLSMGTAMAFECPKHFSEADKAINSATEAMNAMPDGDQKGLVHTLLDDAKAFLQSGKHNHEKPAAGAYDHARSIAKAQAAIGYATAAELLAKR